MKRGPVNARGEKLKPPAKRKPKPAKRPYTAPVLREIVKPTKAQRAVIESIKARAKPVELPRESIAAIADAVAAVVPAAVRAIAPAFKIDREMAAAAITVTRDPNRKAHRVTRSLVEREGTEAPRLLYAFFDHANAELFGGRLGAPMIWISQTSSPTALGDYTSKDVHGISSRIRIAPATYKRGLRHVLATMLHEMVHAYCYEVLNNPEPGYKGHGPVFAGECNRIGKILMFAEVAPKGRGDLARAENWPNLVPSDDDPPAKVRKEKTPAAPSTSTTEGDEAGGPDPDGAPAMRTAAAERADVVRFLEAAALNVRSTKLFERLHGLAQCIAAGEHLGDSLTEGTGDE